jgi:apolipoprotein D and lipocalin family protein
MRVFLGILAFVSALMMSGCSTTRADLPTADYVDLPRFMGPWFVHGYTPIIVDRAAHNALEIYELRDDGRIDTTYQFRKGGFEGKLSTYHPVGTVHDEQTNAEWRMQFIWPFQAKYIIMYLSDDYRETIIAHPNRRYAWIMTRSPELPEERYKELLQKLEGEGFDPLIMERVPHDWSYEPERKPAPF